MQSTNKSAIERLKELVSAVSFNPMGKAFGTREFRSPRKSVASSLIPSSDGYITLLDVRPKLTATGIPYHGKLSYTAGKKAKSQRKRSNARKTHRRAKARRKAASR